MRYVFKEKLNLHDLAGLEQQKKLALLAEQEQYLAGVYKRMLEQHEYEVRLCVELEKLLETIREVNPHVLIVNPHTSTLPPVKVLKIVTEGFPELPIVTLGYDLSAEQVKEFMGLGVVSHINRKMTKPQDIVSVLNMILKK